MSYFVNCWMKKEVKKERNRIKSNTQQRTAATGVMCSRLCVEFLPKKETHFEWFISENCVAWEISIVRCSFEYMKTYVTDVCLRSCKKSVARLKHWDTPGVIIWSVLANNSWLSSCSITTTILRRYEDIDQFVPISMLFVFADLRNEFISSSVQRLISSM